MVGAANQAAFAMPDKSTKPKPAASAYPPSTPTKIGMIAIKPRNTTEPRIVITRVKIETVITFGSKVFAVKPAISAATGASSRPITATMAPIAAGGKTTSIHLVPITLRLSATIVKIAPTAMKPPKAAP
ncbi:hypothetical protein SDC9_207074 [bioreactor metagenome]|uniref:Uncharacterized protein n=1 Tax=bioreactor metagenome TaxID=1076179 RepID=A0A645JIA3_9ZZZZ